MKFSFQSVELFIYMFFMFHIVVEQFGFITDNRCSVAWICQNQKTISFHTDELAFTSSIQSARKLFIFECSLFCPWMRKSVFSCLNVSFNDMNRSEAENVIIWCREACIYMFEQFENGRECWVLVPNLIIFIDLESQSDWICLLS